MGWLENRLKNSAKPVDPQTDNWLLNRLNQSNNQNWEEAKQMQPTPFVGGYPQYPKQEPQPQEEPQPNILEGLFKALESATRPQSKTVEWVREAAKREGFATPAVEQRAEQFVRQAPTEFTEQYDKYMSWWGEQVTTPFRGGRTYEQWRQEHPWGAMIAEMTEPIGFIVPGGEGAGAGRKLVINLLKKATPTEEILAQLAKIKITGIEAEKLLNEVYANWGKLVKGIDLEKAAKKIAPQIETPPAVKAKVTPVEALPQATRGPAEPSPKYPWQELPGETLAPSVPGVKPTQASTVPKLSEWLGFSKTPVPEQAPLGGRPATGGIPEFPPEGLPKQPKLGQPPPIKPPGGIPPQTAEGMAPISPTTGGVSKILGDLSDFNETTTTAFKQDIIRKLANLPPFKGISQLLGGMAATAKEPVEKALIGRAMLRAEGQVKTVGAMSTLEKLGPSKGVFNLAEDGTIKVGTLKGIHLNEIRTYPQKYVDKLNLKQRNWVEQAQKIEEDKLRFLKDNEININELAFDEGGHYAGRKVLGIVKDGELLETAYIGGGVGRIGGKAGFEKVRTFENIADAIKAGFRYLPEEEALYYNTMAAYNRVVDKKMSEWLLQRIPWRTTGADESLVLAAEVATQKYARAKLLVEALNRAVRGERLPESTINAISQSFPEEANILKKLLPKLQEENAKTAEVIQSLTGRAKNLLRDTQLEAAEARTARAESRVLAEKTRFGEARVAHPAFAGKIFTGEDAQKTAETLRKTFTPEFSEVLGAINKANAVGRYFALAGDASPFMIQLIFLAGANPVIYGKAAGGFVQALFSKEFVANYLTKHLSTIQNSKNLILSHGGTTEFTEMASRGGLLSTKVGKVIGKPLEPFMRAFEAAIDVAGIEMREAFDHLATTSERAAQLENFINEFRGLANTARIGVGTKQRQLETATLLAPRYNRAIAALLVDAIRGVVGQGGLRGSLARNSLAKGITAICAMSAAISFAMGESPEQIAEHFEPNSSKFLTWRIEGQNIGPGSKVRSLIVLLARSWNEPENLIKLSMENPGLAFVRGNLAPAVSTGLDLLIGQNYIGDPTREGLLDATKAIFAENMLPIWLQTVALEGGDLKQRVSRGLAEFMGMRTYPETPYQQREELRETYAQKIFGKKYDELNQGEKKQLSRDYPDLKKLEENYKVKQIDRDPIAKAVYETENEIRNKRDTQLNKIATSLLNDEISHYDYDQERGYIRPTFSGGSSALWLLRNKVDPETMKKIDEYIQKNQTLEDKALDEYYNFNDKLMEQADLPKDWDDIEAQTEKFLKKYSEKIRQYIKEQKDAWIYDLPPEARKVELMRLEMIEDESWWDNYRGDRKKPIVPWLNIPSLQRTPVFKPLK